MRIASLRNFCALALFSLSGFCQAATYSYTSLPFTTAFAPYTTSDTLSGSFTTANPIPASSTVDLSAQLQSFSFTDGQATRTASDSVICQFSVTTNAAGAITSWDILVRQEPTPAGGFQHSLETHAGVINTELVGFSAIADTTGCGVLSLDPTADNQNSPNPAGWSLSGAIPPPLVVVQAPTLSPMSLGLMAGLILLVATLVLRRRAR